VYTGFKSIKLLGCYTMKHTPLDDVNEGRVIAFIDIETDALDAKKIHVCCVKRVTDKEVYVYKDSDKFKKETTDIDKFIGHNIVDFDAPILNRIWNTKLTIDKLFDTLILSQILSPQREGGNSLKVWGVRLGFDKMDFDNFEHFSEEMVTYCKNDVILTEKLYNKLTKDKEQYKFSDKSIELEHKIRDVIRKQTEYGFYLDEQKAHTLYIETKSKADKIKTDIKKELRPKPVVDKEVKLKYKKDGSISKVGLRGYDISGDCTLFNYREFNLDSPKQIVERMTEFGWKPVDFTPKGTPRVTENNLATLPNNAPDVAKKVAEWKMLETRWKTINSWLDNLGDDGRVHGRVQTLGTVTGRMSHSDPNMANIISVRKPYGYESRACWTVKDNTKKCLVGMDAQGLELRMLAHYMGDPSYSTIVVDGDPHSENQRKAGLATRDMAKTFIYAFLYGAGVAKIGKIVNGSSKDGIALKKRFLKNLPSLQKLIDKVQKAAQRGHVRGLDGRRIFIRHQHASLNSLLQGAGAIVCKQWSIFMDKAIQSERLNAHLVNTIHDELQYEVDKNHATRIIELADSTMQDVGKFFNMRVRLNAEARQGNNWAETH